MEEPIVGPKTKPSATLLRRKVLELVGGDQIRSSRERNLPGITITIELYSLDF
jgi:hypothetical protein